MIKGDIYPYKKIETIIDHCRHDYESLHQVKQWSIECWNVHEQMHERFPHLNNTSSVDGGRFSSKRALNFEAHSIVNIQKPLSTLLPSIGAWKLHNMLILLEWYIHRDTLYISQCQFCLGRKDLIDCELIRGLCQVLKPRCSRKQR